MSLLKNVDFMLGCSCYYLMIEEFMNWMLLENDSCCFWFDFDGLVNDYHVIRRHHAKIHLDFVRTYI